MRSPMKGSPSLAESTRRLYRLVVGKHSFCPTPPAFKHQGNVSRLPAEAATEIRWSQEMASMNQGDEKKEP
jgi:hypothetical protein